jgi:hypothetical protein
MVLLLPDVPFWGLFCMGVVIGWCSSCRVVGAAHFVPGEGGTTITARQRADHPGFVSMDCPAMMAVCSGLVKVLRRSNLDNAWT